MSRAKLHEALYALGLKSIENRRSMPVYEEDVAKDEWIHQLVEDDGIITVAQRHYENLTAKRVMGFGYDIAKYMTILTDGRAELTELRDDGH